MLMVGDYALDAHAPSENSDPDGRREENQMWAARSLDIVLGLHCVAGLEGQYPNIKPGTSAMMHLAPAIANYYGIDHHDALSAWGVLYAPYHAMRLNIDRRDLEAGYALLKTEMARAADGGVMTE